MAGKKWHDDDLLEQGTAWLTKHFQLALADAMISEGPKEAERIKRAWLAFISTRIFTWSDCRHLRKMLGLEKKIRIKAFEKLRQDIMELRCVRQRLKQWAIPWVPYYVRSQVKASRLYPLGGDYPQIDSWITSRNSNKAKIKELHAEVHRKVQRNHEITELISSRKKRYRYLRETGFPPRKPLP